MEVLLLFLKFSELNKMTKKKSHVKFVKGWLQSIRHTFGREKILQFSLGQFTLDCERHFSKIETFQALK